MYKTMTCLGKARAVHDVLCNGISSHNMLFHYSHAVRNNIHIFTNFKTKNTNLINVFSKSRHSAS